MALQLECSVETKLLELQQSTLFMCHFLCFVRLLTPCKWCEIRLRQATKSVCSMISCRVCPFLYYESMAEPHCHCRPARIQLLDQCSVVREGNCSHVIPGAAGRRTWWCAVPHPHELQAGYTFVWFCKVRLILFRWLLRS